MNLPIEMNKTVLGLELGSTRIKTVLLDGEYRQIASGSFDWENKLINGIWTYSMESVHHGLRACYAALKEDFEERFACPLRLVGAIGISGMMHGFLPFDKYGRQLTEFRTWRNTITSQAAQELSEQLNFNIPQRWSIAHLYQALLNGEPIVNDISYITTLSGYIHWKLTGRRQMGVGEASGIFPIDSDTVDYDREMVRRFDALAASHGAKWKLLELLPEVLPAGTAAGTLTREGAAFLDPTGTLEPGIPLAPCEGDAGTGMVATNSVRINIGNVSAGTSGFAMLVTDKKLGRHREIDMVTTPSGKPVAMVHCNNCTSDINAWVGIFEEFAAAIGSPRSKAELFTLLFQKALAGAPDGGGLISYNYFSGEGITDINDGRPVFARCPDCDFSLSNFIRTHLLSAMATLSIGMDILTETEGVKIDRINGHGGFFKTPEVGQRILSAALEAPVTVMKNSGEGGPYGMALLAAFMLRHDKEESLEDFLDKKVFNNVKTSTIMANEAEIDGFRRFKKRYVAAFPMERSAVDTLNKNKKR